MAISFGGTVGGKARWLTPPPEATDPLHWRRQGGRARAAGDAAGAAAAFARYLAAPVRLPALQAAVAAQQANDPATAERRVRAFLATDPDDPVAFRMLGQLAMTAGRAEDAERILAQVVALAPGFLPVRFERGQARLMQGKAAEALADADHLVVAAPGQPAFRALQADALSRLGEFAAAADLYAALVAERPNEPALWLAYGFLLRTLRRSTEAIAAFRHVTTVAPQVGEAWWHLANMKTGLLTAEDRAAIAAALADARAGAVDRYHLRFALARALEEAGAYPEAFAEYKRANAARAAELPRAAVEDPAVRVARATALFTPGLLRARGASGDPAPDPIFILGMPRSGSTLLEQILAAHPLIEGTQELPDLPLLARRLDATGPGGHGAYPAVLATLPDADLRAIGAEYLARAARQRKTDRPRFLDKQPANWMHVGLIRLALPNARILDVWRDPLACCLSMFRQHFARGAAFTYSIARLAAEYRAYHNMMAHWAMVAPDAVRRVALHDLQADLPGELGRLLAHLGLPFAAECLDFHRSDRAVFTPSSEQVRRPINRDGDAVLAAFLPHIGELRDALGDLAS